MFGTFAHIEGGDGTGLNQVNLAIFDGELAILGKEIMLMNFHGKFSQLDYFFVSEFGSVDHFLRNLYFFDPAGIVVDFHNGLRYILTRMNRKVGLIYYVMIRVNYSLNHEITQSPDCFNDDLIFVAGDRINREKNAGDI